MSSPVKDQNFTLLSEMIRPDAKRRLNLGHAVGEEGVGYNVYRNRIGQIVLDPVKAVPAYKTWLFGDKGALASVKRGLADAAAGRTKKRGSFAVYSPRR